VVGCGYFLLSVALCQRLFRPRAKAAYSSRSRCSRPRSTVCQGDTRYDKNRIRSDPPSSRVHRTVPRQPYPDICSDKQPTYNMLCFALDCGQSALLLAYAPFSSLTYASGSRVRGLQASSTPARVRTGLSLRRLRLLPTGNPTRTTDYAYDPLILLPLLVATPLLHPLDFFQHRT
jgi:hypothetical protein